MGIEGLGEFSMKVEWLKDFLIGVECLIGFSMEVECLNDFTIGVTCLNDFMISRVIRIWAFRLKAYYLIAPGIARGKCTPFLSRPERA